MPVLTRRFTQIEPSASLAIAAEARRLRRLGKPVIDLSVGELDFPTPANICEAALRAIHGGATRYDSTAGVLVLREAIRAKLRRENALDYSVDQIIVGCGAKQIISSALLASVEADDEVIIPVPYWTSYPEMVRLAGGRPVLADTLATGFKIRPEELRRHITPRTKWLILNSPNNPSGAVYSHAELELLGHELARHPHVAILSDEIYESMVYPPSTFVSIASAVPGLFDRILLVNGVSKSYAMTGWRVGYGAGAVDIVKAIGDLQSQMTTHTSTISQHAAVEALNGDQTARTRFAAQMGDRARRMMELIQRTRGLSCAAPGGAFYCFANCGELLGKRAGGRLLGSDTDVAGYLLDEALVAVVPGRAYGASPFLRFSFAVDVQIVELAFNRIADAIDRLR